jgi:hypothetical protein
MSRLRWRLTFAERRKKRANARLINTTKGERKMEIKERLTVSGVSHFRDLLEAPHPNDMYSRLRKLENMLESGKLVELTDGEKIMTLKDQKKIDDVLKQIKEAVDLIRLSEAK